MRRNGLHLARVAILTVLVTVLTYFTLDAIFELPVAASSEAGPIDTMFNVHFMLISFLFSLIMVFVLYSAFAFRKREGDEEEGAYFHGHTKLEIAWTVLPLLIVIAFGVYAATVFSDLVRPKEGEMTVRVIGRQWSWAFEYPDYPDIGTISELILPVDQPILLEMESHDVLHSFWVPEFRVKQDLVPGHITELRVEPTRIGEYKVRCAEVCGFGHTNMLARVAVLSEADFEDWVAEQSISLTDLSAAERGEKWSLEFGCLACHSTSGDVAAGPTWLELVGREESLADGSNLTVDEAYLLSSIMAPGSQIVNGFTDIMPADFEVRFGEKEAELEASKDLDLDIAADIIAYITTLSEE